MPPSGSVPEYPAANVLHFTCGGCHSCLEVGVGFAGVEAPCPVCGIPVRAPLDDSAYWQALGLVPIRSPRPPESGGAAGIQPLPSAPVWNRLSLPPGRDEAPAPTGEQWTREKEEAAAAQRHRRRARRLKVFDAVLGLLLLGMLVLGGAALAFTQPKADALPQAPPELSALVLERMQQLDRQRDQAVQSARSSLSALLGAKDAVAADPFFLPGSLKPADFKFPLFPGSVPDDFEFIQARRIAGTDRFLSIFEMASDPPMVVPVEETPAGSRVHGGALAQQSLGRLGKFLASQGAGEAVFYVLLRPAPPPMAADLLKSRPDLKPFYLVAIEPAFPADGAAGCLVCLAPGSEAAEIFARRAHDSGLRPAVVTLAWRQHRESGNFVELAAFEPNAWSRH